MRAKSYSKGLLHWLARWAFRLAGIIIVWVVRQLARLTWWCTRQLVTHPRSTFGLGGLGLAAYLTGWETVVAVGLVVLIAGSTWRAADATSFERIVGDWLRSWWRRWAIYRRTWDQVMTRCQLTVQVGEETHIPRLVELDQSPYWDRLTVAMQVGQEVADFQTGAERIRHAFKAARVTCHEAAPAGVEIALMKRDPFVHEPVPAAAMPATSAEIVWSGIPIGMTEYCRPWTVSLVGGHTAVPGTSGSGKASITWNILRSVAPAVADGSVRLHLVDPKRMELRQARSLAANHSPILEERVGGGRYPEIKLVPGDERKSYVCGPEETLAMLRGLVEEMNLTQELAGERGERDHEPSPETPLNLIIIDELAPLIHYWQRSLVDKILDALGLLLTQGRAVGYIVLASIQEPTKDIFKIRDLFSRRIALRLPTSDHTDAALTDGAIQRGALCHEIPESLPGVAFELLAGGSRATRNRAGHVPNAAIVEFVEYVEHLRLALDVSPTPTEPTAASPDLDLRKAAA
ncbi:FtsK/SpoIIIE domain-containing protein [Actinokineospora sp. NBRC 105648]|uniref:FtsK/SpoIIIE domain-containing protein n=1 Tax=Actinokineospora sp. NBRC 105648 TaxID=3032206 RepID=UPI0024A4C8C0|nr:FtsK/SpoIIIE domain-containing protein [Actinokineospora sp. NBRC 105648]GLZ43723.1 cell division protein FtsK [Actinokineospora sp. NBRC 105648]